MPKNINSQIKAKHQNIKTIYIAALVIGFVAFIATSPQSLIRTFESVNSSDKSLLILAILSISFTYLSASCVYQLISLKRLSFMKTLTVQIANGFTNRVLPAGTGGLATSTFYLIKNGHSPLTSAIIAGLNNALGMIGHMAILGVLLLLTPDNVRFQYFSSPWIKGLAAIVIISLLVTLASRGSKWLGKITKSIHQIKKYYSGHPLRLLYALILNVVTTLLYALTFYLALKATNIHPSYVAAFLIFSAGIGAGSITPTPGGIGGVEATMTAGLISLGCSGMESFSAVLLYRMVSFWMPIIPGFIALRLAVNRHWI